MQFYRVISVSETKGALSVAVKKISKTAISFPASAILLDGTKSTVTHSARRATLSTNLTPIRTQLLSFNVTGKKSTTLYIVVM